MTTPRLVEAVGAIDDVNTEFTTASPYYAGSVFAYYNGVLIRAADDDGFFELGGNLIQMKRAPHVDDTLHFYYSETAPVGGAFYGPPDWVEIIHLLPEMYLPVILQPDMVEAIDETAENSIPENLSAINLEPQVVTIELRPEIISAEEE